MNAHAILKRFSNTPENLLVPHANLLTDWHFHQQGEPIDSQILDPDPWGKGPQPLNSDGLLRRSALQRREQQRHGSGASGGAPLGINVEPGARVFNYRHEQDRQALAHIGKIVRTLGDVDHVYGNFYKGKPANELTLQSDLAVYSLIGCPNRLAISFYGEWSQHWGSERYPYVVRSLMLANAISFKDVRVVAYISPYNAATGKLHSLEDWSRICTATLTICRAYDIDVIMWADGTRSRIDYNIIEPYVRLYYNTFYT